MLFQLEQERRESITLRTEHDIMMAHYVPVYVMLPVGLSFISFLHKNFRSNLEGLLNFSWTA